MPFDSAIDTAYSDPVLACLRQARAHIQLHGWCQRKMIDEDGKVCLRGALAGITAPATYDWGPSAEEADKLLAEVCGEYVPAWNNAHDRTISDVFDLLDRAITARESAARESAETHA